ncbi:MAG: DNA mismatch repair protein MutS, partial [Acidobacteriota bacterium]
MSSSIAPSLTPMLRQYLEVKAEYPDALLMIRMGDFYEMFFEDARLAAPLLEVQLTARNRGSENEAPMCGIPHHALESYLGKILAAGLKVAICDQVEDPALAKGLVRREVTRVVTPGTLSDPELLDGKEENLLAGLVWDKEIGSGAFLDLSTGTFYVRRWKSAEDAVEDLALIRPREVLFHAASGTDGFPPAVVEWAERECPCRTVLPGDRLFDPKRAGDLLLRQFGAGSLRGFGLEEGEPAVRAAAAALAYAQETQKSRLEHVRGLAVQEARDRLILDAA